MAKTEDVIEILVPIRISTKDILPHIMGEVNKRVSTINQDEEFYTVKEVSEMVKKGDRTIRRHIDSGILKAFKNQNTWLISKQHLKEYLDRK